MENEDYNRIGSETLESLCDAMRGFAEVAEESAKVFEGYSKAMSKLMLENALSSFYTQVEHYIQAPFLIKWWYKRKLNKMKYVLPELIRMVKETYEEV